MTRRSKSSSARLRPWSVVVVPFPFVEGGGVKRRPALVVSTAAFAPSGHVMLAMITTGGRRSWPGDVELADYRKAGLRRPCIVRLKLFTLDRRLVLRTIGRLSEGDRKSAADSFRRHLAA